MKPQLNNWRNLGSVVSIDERRSEPREGACGLVRLFRVEDERLMFEGDLLDASPNGFRLEHDHQRVCAGEEYRFESPSNSGLARVMWNRILDEAVETGFLIVYCDPAE